MSMTLRRQAFATSALAVLMALMLSAGVIAQGNSQGRGRGQGGASADTPKSAPETVVFRKSDHATFRDYFTKNRITAETLPPGIAKNVARGKPLPPGIAKKVLPAGLVPLAPKVDKDVTFAIVGDSVVAMRRDVVVDVLTGVLK